MTTPDPAGETVQLVVNGLESRVRVVRHLVEAILLPALAEAAARPRAHRRAFAFVVGPPGGGQSTQALVRRICSSSPVRPGAMVELSSGRRSIWFRPIGCVRRTASTSTTGKPKTNPSAAMRLASASVRSGSCVPITAASCCGVSVSAASVAFHRVKPQRGVLLYLS